MQTLLQLVITALQIGAIYVLFCLGFTLVFGVMNVVNFAHGHFFGLTALMIACLIPQVMAMGFSSLPAYLLSAGAGIAVTLVLAAVIYQTGLRFFLRNFEGAFIITLGMGILLDGILLEVFGGFVRPVPEIIGGTVSLLDVAVTIQRLVICIASVLVTVALYLALSKTKSGKALRAVAADAELAMLQGIRYNQISLIAFLISALLAGVAGAFIAPLTAVQPAIGTDYMMKGWISVVIGGLGSIPGAILGGLFIGLVDSFVGYYFDSSTATLTFLALVIVVLIFRPKGILGTG